MNDLDMTPAQGIPEAAGDVLTKEDLAKRWKISTKTVERIFRDRINGIRHFMVGQRVRFRLRDVQEFEKKHLTRLRGF